MDKKTALFLYGGLGVGIFLIYLYYQKNGNPFAKDATGASTSTGTGNTTTNTGTNTNTTNTGGTTIATDNNKILYKGITGYNTEIRTLQTLLNRQFGINPQLTVDGNFGQLTENALYAAKSKTRSSINQYLSITPY